MAACLFIDLPFKGSKLLGIPHNLAEVNVEHVSAGFQHDVVVVTVTDPQDERGHAPAGARVDEVHHSLRWHGGATLHNAHQTGYSRERPMHTVHIQNIL